MRRNRADLLRVLTTYAPGSGLGLVGACAIAVPAQTLRLAAAHAAAVSFAVEAARDINGR